MKVHVGVDATAANVDDITVARKLILEDDTVVYGDLEFLGIDKRKEIIENEKLAKIDYRINQESWKDFKGTQQWRAVVGMSDRTQKILSVQ